MYKHNHDDFRKWLLKWLEEIKKIRKEIKKEKYEQVKKIKAIREGASDEYKEMSSEEKDKLNKCVEELLDQYFK